jgi:hypothetical protein
VTRDDDDDDDGDDDDDDDVNNNNNNNNNNHINNKYSGRACKLTTHDIQKPGQRRRYGAYPLA